LKEDEEIGWILRLNARKILAGEVYFGIVAIRQVQSSQFEAVGVLACAFRAATAQE
jgi:hypothetical protein